MHSSAKTRVTAAFALTLMLLALVNPPPSGASPVLHESELIGQRQVLPDWMPSETAAQFVIGIDVLVPASLPSPFSGLPEISVQSGYYSLYWYAGNDPPTFLQVIGTAGGEIPAYSKYDRNVELTANATVGGATAYHDLTPIYDLVYWEVGGVVYSIESQNSSIDSLSLANGLSLLAVPVTEVPLSGAVTSPDQVAGGGIGTVSVSVTGDATLTADAGFFTATGASTIGVSGDIAVDWQAPSVVESTSTTFQLIDPSDGTVLASTPTLVIAESQTIDDTPVEVSIDWALDCPSIGLAGEAVTVIATGPSQATISTNNGSFSGGSPAVVLNLEGSLEIDFNLPDDGSFSVLLALADGESVVATCEIQISTDESEVIEEPTETPTELPAGHFPGDGTDLTIGTGGTPTVPEGIGTATPAPTKDPALISGDGTGILEATRVVPPTVAPTPTRTSTPRPGEPTATPSPTETLIPTSSPTPENPIPTMVPQVGDDGDLIALEIGRDGGQLDSPFGVQIVVPEDTFTDLTSVTVQPVADNQVPIQTGIDLVPESAFNIAFAQLSGRGVELGEKTAQVRIDLGDRYVRGATLYELKDGLATQLSNVGTDGTVLTAELNGPKLLVAGVPVLAPQVGSRSLVPFVIIALTAVILLIVAGSVLTSIRSRRTPTIAKGRSSGGRGRF